MTVSAGSRSYPDDGEEKDDLVAVADRALYLAKPSDRLRPGMDDPTRDPYLAAIDQMALAPAGAPRPRQLLHEIVDRAASLVGVKSGFLYLLEDTDADERARVPASGVGLFDGLDGYRLPRGKGVGWPVVRTGEPLIVDDYDAYPSTAPAASTPVVRQRGAVPLRRTARSSA